MPKKALSAVLMVMVILNSLAIALVARGEGVYRVPITITERSGNDLYNYTVRIDLNSTNFEGWDHVSENGSDIYFTDSVGNPLYYWIEYFNTTEQKATIWVKVPSIPANGQATIYMHYGSDNPYTNYNDPAKVFVFYDDFNNLDNWEATATDGSYSVSDGYLVLSPANEWAGVFLRCKQTVPAPNILVEVRFMLDGVSSSGDPPTHNFHIYVLKPDGSYTRDTSYYWVIEKVDSGALFSYTFSPHPHSSGSGSVAGSGQTGDDVGFYGNQACEYWNVGSLATYSTGAYRVYFYLGSSEVRGWAVKEADGTTVYDYSAAVNQTHLSTLGSQAKIEIGLWGYYVPSNRIDWIRVRKYVEPEPTVGIGSEELPSAVRLPSETMYLVHEITYSPNSTQFSHSFTATNTTTAGYEANYSDVYGWGVYADPYQSGGVDYENNASLVSEVNITLPYSEVLVENVTLLARANGTGSFRQLWVKVLDSAGGVVAELTNATIGTGWTEVALPINASLSNQITIWINATVKSATTAGEEIAVKDVRVHVEYETNPQVTVSQVSPNAEFFNCSATHDVGLGSSEYLNSSVITFKLIQYLAYNTTDYPVQPSYVGDETIGSYSYSVYRIDPADYSQAMTIYALLENRLKTFRTHTKGYDTETVLVGEPLTIELPEPSNITIRELNETFINVTLVTVSFSSAGSYTIVANLTQPAQWKLGYGTKKITVKYGTFSVRPIDTDSREVDYEDLVLQLINKTDGGIVRELIGNKLFNLTDLWAGNYSIVVKFKDVVIGIGDFELNITTDASTADLRCTMKNLVGDYRGLNRTIIYEHDKQLAGVENLSARYPYSRMRILLNGTGSFKLYINYRGDLPTKVRVTSNVTSLQYYWDGNYLVITGSLGSVGEVNVTDLYKLRVEMYDRLGNLMPPWIYAYVNGTKYSGSVVEDYYYPEDYVVELPDAINGFQFYGFFDGCNDTARVVAVNNSDVILKAWYRVPTSVRGLKSYQVASLWWLPFIRQEGETVRVYVEGYLRDYYGDGVPGRPVMINVTDTETGYTRSYNATTDATGYFRTPLLELFRGKTYRVEVVYNGDDVYVGTMSTAEVKPEELPAAPAFVGIPVNYLLLTIGIALIAFGVFAAARAARHAIEGMRERSRKFVRKKR